MSAAEQNARSTVVVVGGGYGGVAVAKALDVSSDITLIEPKDAFMHNIAALRALVDPSWLSKIYFSYADVLANGRVVQDRATLVEPHRVVTSSGEEFDADYIVLATGSRYPFPAKTDLVNAEAASKKIQQTNRALSQAERVLLVGAGPVGIELAGEIREVWPDKAIVLLDVADDVLGGPYKAELREELRRQLTEFRIDVQLGSPLVKEPATEPGELGTFTVATEDGTEVTGDIWFRCYGVSPNSDYLGEELKAARRRDGFVEVTPTLQVVGQTTVFALGDLSTADAKMAGFAGHQAVIVAENINALSHGRSDLVNYQSVGPAIAVPIGPHGGAGQFPGQDEIVGREVIAEAKGRDLMVERFGELFKLTSASEA
jgi:NADH dehydrogenase FAD-containing subunit